MRYLDQALLEQVVAAAQAAPRRRKNHNFHPDDDYPAHRLLNAMEPGSYIRPHCHADPAKDETIVALRGRFGLVSFAPDGRVLATRVLAAGDETIGVDIPHGSFHTLLALEAGSLFFEAKAGPYRPLTPAEQAPWAPAEGEPAAAAYLAGLERLFA